MQFPIRINKTVTAEIQVVYVVSEISAVYVFAVTSRTDVHRVIGHFPYATAKELVVLIDKLPIFFKVTGTVAHCVTVFAEEEMETWCLKLYARSSIGIKDRVVVTNAVGIIDSDYQFAENDGDMMLALTNIGSEEKMYGPGYRICQAIFEIHGITSDDAAFGKRTGGLGSTSIR